MPVIGHTLVGIVIAQQVEPGAGTPPSSSPSWARVWWLPCVVLLSYLPDLLTQVGIWLRIPWAREAGHSVLLAAAAGAVSGAVWSRLAGTSRLHTVAIATCIILLHDALDLFQDSERMPLWPLSSWETGVDWLMFGNRIAGEAVVFGVPFAVYQLWRHSRGYPSPWAHLPLSARWTLVLFLCGMLAATAGVVRLRQQRGAQMAHAEELLRARRYTEALAVIDDAERWPSARGEGDLLRGRVYVRMGEDALAEEVFMRAWRSDPDDFWPTAVLAEFHASRGPAATRRVRSASYVETLRTRFAENESFPRVMGRIERSLAAVP